MFNTDLPLTKGQEKVGERRERKAQARSNTLTAFETRTTTGSISSTDHEQWWSTGLKKAISVKTNILRPANRTSASKRPEQTLPKELDIKLAQGFKDPVLQPDWTYSTTLSPTLPSGAPLDRLELDVPDLEGDTSSWQTESVDSHHSYDRWEVRTPKNVGASRVSYSPESMSPESCKTYPTRRSSVCTEREPLARGTNSQTKRKVKRRPQTVIIESSLSLDALKLHDALQNGKVPEDLQQSPIDNLGLDSRIASRPTSQWAPKSTGMPLLPFVKQIIPAPIEPRFCRSIRQMKSASPETILDQMKDSLQFPMGEVLNAELALERQFWLSTSFETHIQSKAGIPPSPDCDTGRVLELYSNLSEVYQSSASNPSQTVHYLTTKLKRTISLPGNVSYLTTRDVGSVPLPYPENYFSHIKASMLPSLVPSANLPQLFSECYKLLAPGGLLEIRILDAPPVRKTTGPLMRSWVEDRLSINLERLFRCSKPCQLVPAWLKDADFELCDETAGQSVTLPCATDPFCTDPEKELTTAIARCLWKSAWGSFVGDASDEPKWWWEDTEIVQECLERQTQIECRTVFAYKR